MNIIKRQIVPLEELEKQTTAFVEDVKAAVELGDVEYWAEIQKGYTDLQKGISDYEL